MNETRIKKTSEKVCPLNLDATLYSGQVPHFCFNKISDIKHVGFIKKDLDYFPVALYNNDSFLRIVSEAPINEVKEFLSFGHDMVDICEYISTDKFIKGAIESFKGLRITKSDPLLSLLVFISSSNNSLKNIRNFLSNISVKFGQKISFEGVNLHLPPPDHKLFDMNQKDFKSCKAGYRSKYLAQTFDMIKEKVIDLDRLNRFGHEKVRTELQQLPGVGNKVADCVSLFAYSNLESFPIDTNIRQIMISKYLNHNSSNSEIRSFARKKWGPMEGYAQQYIFKKAIQDK